MSPVDRLTIIEKLVSDATAESEVVRWNEGHARAVGYGQLLHTQAQLRHEIAMLRLQLEGMTLAYAPGIGADL